MEYRDGIRDPCQSSDLPYGHPDNRTGSGWLPEHPYDFGWDPQYIRPVGPFFAPSKLQWDSQGNPWGDHHYYSQFPGEPMVQRTNSSIWRIGRGASTVSESSRR